MNATIWITAKVDTGQARRIASRIRNYSSAPDAIAALEEEELSIC